MHGVLHHFGFEITHAGQLPVLTRTSMSYYCQPDVRNSYKFVILKFLANSSAVWLQFLDAYHRPFSVGIPTVFVDEGGFLASYLSLWLSRLPTITTPVNHQLPICGKCHMSQMAVTLRTCGNLVNRDDTSSMPLHSSCLEGCFSF